MRSAALCLLAISTSACNWLLGLDPTLKVDAGSGPPTDGPLPIARLTWMIATTDLLGNPLSSPELPPLPPTASVKIGRIAEELTPVTVDATGEFKIPYDYATTPWRLVYQLENDLPHEVHWTPTANRVPHATVPLFGRLVRAPIPGPNTTMVLNPTGSPANHTGPRVVTTGVWTESQPVFPVPPGTSFTYNLNSSLQLSGPPGAPEHMKGDRVFLIDYSTTSNCRRSIGSAGFALSLVDGPSTTVSSEPWANTSVGIAAASLQQADPLRAAFTAGSNDPGIVTTVTQFGPAPSNAMPAFTLRYPQVGLRSPVLLVLLQCTGDNFTGLPAYNLPPSLSQFPQLAHVQLSAPRVVSGGPTLTSGLEAVHPIVSGTVTFDVGIGAASAPFMLGPDDIGTNDHMVLTAGTDPLTLSFTNEPQAMPPDYYDVVLHRVAGTSAIPERIYTIVGTSLTIERDVFAANTEYVFEIRAYLGAPDASLADFRRYLTTQSSAVVWTHTFRTP